jgi:AcrR family transcriptional regulator
MKQIAERAGVAKTSVYRRAPDKAHLVFEVLFGGDAQSPTPGDLRELIAQLSVQFTDPVGRAAMPGLFAEFASRPELAERVRTAMLAPAYAAVQATFGDHDATLVSDMLFGAVFVRALIFDRPVGPEVTDALIDIVEGARLREPRP